jgi:hypothetical protein
MAIFVFKDYSPPKETLDRQHRTFTPEPTQQNLPYGRESKPFNQKTYQIPKQEPERSRRPSAGGAGNQSSAGDLTPRQFEVFRHMLAFQDECGRPPTQLELSTRLNMKSEQGVKAHLAILEAKGYVVSSQKYGHRNKVAVWPEAAHKEF